MKINEARNLNNRAIIEEEKFQEDPYYKKT